MPLFGYPEQQTGLDLSNTLGQVMGPGATRGKKLQAPKPEFPKVAGVDPNPWVKYITDHNLQVDEHQRRMAGYDESSAAMDQIIRQQMSQYMPLEKQIELMAGKGKVDEQEIQNQYLPLNEILNQRLMNEQVTNAMTQNDYAPMEHMIGARKGMADIGLEDTQTRAGQQGIDNAQRTEKLKLIEALSQTMDSSYTPLINKMLQELYPDLAPAGETHPTGTGQQGGTTPQTPPTGAPPPQTSGLGGGLKAAAGGAVTGAGGVLGARGGNYLKGKALGALEGSSFAERLPWMAKGVGMGAKALPLVGTLGGMMLSEAMLSPEEQQLQQEHPIMTGLGFMSGGMITPRMYPSLSKAGKNMKDFAVQGSGFAPPKPGVAPGKPVQPTVAPGSVPQPPANPDQLTFENYLTQGFAPQPALVPAPQGGVPTPTPPVPAQSAPPEGTPKKATPTKVSKPAAKASIGKKGAKMAKDPLIDKAMENFAALKAAEEAETLEAGKETPAPKKVTTKKAPVKKETPPDKKKK